MFLELIEIEVCVLGERFLDVGIEVNSQQTATVIGAERNLATGVG